MLPQFCVVKLLTDAYGYRGVTAGAIGAILEVHDEDAYEVEFSRPDGTTIAWFAVPKDAVELVAPAESSPRLAKSGS